MHYDLVIMTGAGVTRWLLFLPVAVWRLESVMASGTMTSTCNTAVWTSVWAATRSFSFGGGALLRHLSGPATVDGTPRITVMNPYSNASRVHLRLAQCLAANGTISPVLALLARYDAWRALRPQHDPRLGQGF